MAGDASHNDQPASVAAWREAATNQSIVHAMRSLYDDIARQTAARRPVCTISGRCCHFEAYDHRLYITGLEAAVLISHISADSADLTAHSIARAREAGTCPFLEHERCTVHSIRPMGCRLFFCDSTATDWQSQQYERAHQRIVALHREFNIPYHYAEWRAVLSMFIESHDSGKPPSPAPSNIATPSSPFTPLRIKP